MVDTVVIIGSGSLLGHAFNLTLKKKKLNIINFPKSDLDIRNYERVKSVLSKIKPKIVINTAAFMNADKCEQYPIDAYEVNVLGTKNVAKVCNELNAIHVWFSSDFVFDGKKTEAYKETDDTKPLMFYGKTKELGEKEILHHGGKYYIIRTASLFGPGKVNFISSMIDKSTSEESLNIVNDIIMSPTYTLDLSYNVLKLINNSYPFGIYHITNQGECSWYDLCKKAFEIKSIETNINPTSIENRRNKYDLVTRPHFSALSSEKGIKLRSWESALEKYLMEYLL
jgi:dTDP-4-dehydrorhamnose reductase